MVPEMYKNAQDLDVIIGIKAGRRVLTTATS